MCMYAWLKIACKRIHLAWANNGCCDKFSSCYCFVLTFTASEQLVDVKNEIGHFAQWRALGLNLRLPASSLEVIEEDYRRTDERVAAVLLQWLRENYNVQKYGPPSWGQLADAVEPINHALASTIKERHPLS